LRDLNIDEAILSHRRWVVKFRDSIQGVAKEEFDIYMASDHATCDFGQWLYAKAKIVIAPELLEHTINLHKSFHEVAGKIAMMINCNDDSEELDQFLLELDNLSRQLINLLLVSKKLRLNPERLHNP